jgi:hypothetical protein
MLTPGTSGQPFRRIYLASSQFKGKFSRNANTGKVALSSEMKQIPITRQEILGIVVGFWWHFPEPIEEGE